MKSHKRTDHFQKRQPEECKLAWNCPLLLKKKCQYKHDPEDFDNAESLQSILKRNNKEFVIIFDKLPKQYERKALCLFDPYLPILLSGIIEPPLEPG